MPPLTEKQKEYQREYSRKNRERISAKNKRYREENGEALRAYDKARHPKRYAALKVKLETGEDARKRRRDAVYRWRLRWPDKVKVVRAMWRDKNPDYVAPHRKDIDRERRLWREMYARNQEREKTRAHNKRARKANLPGSHTEQEWLDLVRKFGGRCAYCGCSDQPLTRDHVIPIARKRLKPSNNISNIVPACGPCNFSKRTKTAKEFRVWIRRKECQRQMTLRV